MNALLINPWITDFAAYDFWDKPLGLLYIGAFLERAGWTVRLIDCMDRHQPGGGRDIAGKAGSFGTGKFPNTVIEKPACIAHVPRQFRRYGIPVELFEKRLREVPHPDVVLVTGLMTYWYPGVFEAIRRVREHLPGVPVVHGGIYATLCADHARNESGADVVVDSGDPALILATIDEVTSHKDDNNDLPISFSEWPEPLWHLYESLPALSVMTTRGCPLSCTVCASRRLFDGFERRDPVKAAEDIIALANRGADDIAFADDALLLDPETHAMPLFARLADTGAPVRLHTPNGLHVRAITPELASLMKRAGVETIRLSLETSSDDRAADFSRKVSREDFRRAAGALYGAGFTVHNLGAYILAGLPGQTPGEMLNTAAFSLECGIPVKPALFSPVPGTVMFERAVAAGMIRHGDDPLLHNNTLRTVDWWPDSERGYNAFRYRVSAANAALVRGEQTGRIIDSLFN